MKAFLSRIDMRYVITGASGHIGNNLVRMINERFPEAEVVALTRRKILNELSGTHCRQVVGDLGDEAFLRENIHEGDRVIHSAGLIDLSGRKRDEMLSVNYEMTRKISDVSREACVGKFVYIGSVDAIARNGSEESIGEPEDYYPEKHTDCYGETKAMASKYVLDAIKKHPDFRAGIILPSAVIGVNDMKPSEAGKIIRNTLKGKAQLGIKGGYNFVDVLDVCRAVISFCESDFRGQYIISGTNVSVRALYGAIDIYKGLKRRPIIIPTFLAYMACPFVKVLSPLMIKALQDVHNYSSDRAKRELGYCITPFEETVRRTVDWHEENIIK